MHLAVVTSAESWYLADLRRAAAGRHYIEQVTFRGLAAHVGGDVRFTSGGADLRRPDAVLVRAMPPASLEQVVFRMDVLARLEAAGTPVVNPPRALEAAVDKYLATAKLHAAGLLAPPTSVCQTVDDALAAFAALGGDVVVKPLFGAEGRGITRVSDEAVALRVFSTLARLQAVLYLQQFVPHDGCDVRILLIGDRVLAMRRRNPADWRTNLARGAVSEPLSPTDEMVSMARTAAAAIGAPLAGVDLLPGRDGRLYAIEVNAVPGWRGLAAALRVDVAAMVLEYLERLVKLSP